jgi:probable rRNA maturation factor
MNIKVNLQIASKTKSIPTIEQFQKWADLILINHIQGDQELTIRIVDERESALLNEKYRNKSGPTNILSFPADIDPEFNYPLLGDLVICSPIIEKQANQNNKELLAHWAHMITHGILHLLGHNHLTNKEAIIMEELETNILMKFGFPPPYGEK